MKNTVMPGKLIVSYFPPLVRNDKKSGKINKPKNSKKNVGIQLLTVTGIESELILKSLMKVGLKHYILIHGGLIELKQCFKKRLKVNLSPWC